MYIKSSFDKEEHIDWGDFFSPFRPISPSPFLPIVELRFAPMIRSPFHWQIGFPDFMAHILGMGLRRTNTVFDKDYLCISCASPVYLL